MSRSNLKLKFLVRMGGRSSFHVQTQSEIYIVWWGRGSVIFPCPGQIWNLNIFCESLGLVIFLYPDQIWNLKFSMRVGGQSSFHVQTKAEISIFQQRLDGWSSYHTQAKSEIWNFSMGEGSVTFPCPGQIWNLKFLVGADHLSMSRPNL